MRKLFWFMALLCLVVMLLPAAAAAPAAAQSELVADDEIVLINSEDRIIVRDPYAPTGTIPLTWESPQTGFRRVALGDFNGDGSQEIIGLRGGEAHVFDPNRLSNEADVATVFTATTGQVWHIVTTGDFFGNGRDAVVLMQGLNQPNLSARIVAFVFDPATGWSQNWTQDFGALFQGLATGDIDGDNRDELVGIRSGSGFNQIIAWKPSSNWNTIYQGNFDFPWVFVTVGDVQFDSANKDEIVTSRSGVGANLNSYIVFRWVNSTTLETVAGNKYNPNFQRIALGDVTGNGDEEVYLLRPGVVSNTPIVALTSQNYGNDTIVQFNELAGQTRFGNINAGDIDGDGLAEVIVMASNEYIVYTQPSTSRAFQSFPGSYSTSLSFAIGDLGNVPQGPRLSVTPGTVNLTLQAGQTGTQAIQISNIGTGTLNWTSTVTQGSTWLSLQPTSGTAPTTATLRLDATNLIAGTYTGKVRISGQSGVANSPQEVTVNLTVTTPPAPNLSVNPTQIAVTVESGQSTTRQVQITNTGAGTLNWTASLIEGAPWLSFAPSGGTAPSTLTATINAVNVQPGQYTGRIRITGASGVLNSPQDVTISLTVTAPPFSVTPNAVSWAYIPPGTPGTRTVTVTGTGISWHAGVVPTESMERVQAAIDAGRQMTINNGFLVLGDGLEDVPIVDFIDISPSSSSANQTGVTLSLVLNRVPYGLSQAAIVFVADQIASPPAVVVRASVLRTQPGATDLTFLPFASTGQ